MNIFSMPKLLNQKKIKTWKDKLSAIIGIIKSDYDTVGNNSYTIICNYKNKEEDWKMLNIEVSDSEIRTNDKDVFFKYSKDGDGTTTYSL